MIAYIRDHWLGRQGLAWSFWVNLVALKALAFGVQELLSPDKGEDYSSQAFAVLAITALVNGPLLVWQIVGVFRACETYFRDTGSQATVWGAQLASVVFLFLSATYALQAWQFTRPLPKEENHLIRMDREHASRYSMDLDGDTLRFRGSVELGSTRRMTAFVDANPVIRRVILESDGGNVYEGRGLAELFRRKGLATHVETRCASACTLAFSGGMWRTISPDGQLGFHQYKIDADYDVIVADPASEQARDLERFRRAGFSEAFLERVFANRPEEMWFPTASELVEAGVVQEVIAMP